MISANLFRSVRLPPTFFLQFLTYASPVSAGGEIWLQGKCDAPKHFHTTNISQSVVGWGGCFESLVLVGVEYPEAIDDVAFNMHLRCDRARLYCCSGQWSAMVEGWAHGRQAVDWATNTCKRLQLWYIPYTQYALLVMVTHPPTKEWGCVRPISYLTYPGKPVFDKRSKAFRLLNKTVV